MSVGEKEGHGTGQLWTAAKSPDCCISGWLYVAAPLCAGGAVVCGLVSESAVRRGRVCVHVRPFGELEAEYQFMTVTWTKSVCGQP